jgi:hypothetical protein
MYKDLEGGLPDASEMLVVMRQYDDFAIDHLANLGPKKASSSLPDLEKLSVSELPPPSIVGDAIRYQSSLFLNVY